MQSITSEFRRIHKGENKWGIENSEQLTFCRKFATEGDTFIQYFHMYLTIVESEKAKLKVAVMHNLRKLSYLPEMQMLAAEVALKQAELNAK